MVQNRSFIIYNASAGSGKTFTLVKEYLKILLESKHPEKFKHILAITFTNKAVAEMKERIIEMLKLFSEDNILSNPNSMFEAICKELELEPKTIHKKSKRILDSILFNYAAFDISTIDGFTHKLIRTFAYDLKLPLNFEVELDQDALLAEAVDSLIAKAGTDDALTKVLVEFAIEKADDDKSWDVALDLNNISKLLINENDIPFTDNLKDKTLSDFKALKTYLGKQIVATQSTIKELASGALQLIDEAGVAHNDFTRSTLPNHFKKALELNLDGLYNNKLEENIIQRKGLYKKNLDISVANTIEAILPEMEITFKTLKAQVYHYKFLKTFYKNITPLSVLNAINNELMLVKEAQNKMLISEFNTIISKEIKEQPTPFIYERLGEKFKNYFIDEFQDTSVKQWENLIPLLSNSLSAEQGSAMLVGDAKQAIYRWRGGKAEQFIGLFNEDNPFFIEKSIKNLPVNYRSHKEIVFFNNNFFKFISDTLFTNKKYKDLYRFGQQETSLEDTGYLEISFLDFNGTTERDEQFCEATLNTVNNCLKIGYSLKDICVLVRKKKEGVAIANFLSKHEIPIISSETLLLQNAPEVNFIRDVLQLLTQPENKEIKVFVLNYLANSLEVEDKHAFLALHLNLPLYQLFNALERFDIFIEKNLLQLPLYDLTESIVRDFNLLKTSNAYIQFFLDLVLDFSQKKGSDISAFLEYFEKKKESFSIVSPKGQDAVSIMTIHKSKGLEFPVVVFPYADLDIYREKEPKAWFKLNPEIYHGFSYALLNYNKDFEYFGNEGRDIYTERKSQLELDNINLMYVALTRAAEHLYIISAKDISSNGTVNDKKYSGLLINYLKHKSIWNENKTTYHFGSKTRTFSIERETDKTLFQSEFISTSKASHNINILTNSGLLWSTNQEKAIEKGNLIHDIMAKIKTEEDIDFALSEFVNTSTINNEQAENLKQTVLEIVEHAMLSKYFNVSDYIYNERDIITEEGLIIRPDRVNINDKREATIIDYKTGVEREHHYHQLSQYKDVFEKMGFKVTQAILIYVNENVLIKAL
ncbi:exodeoxyribonuclease V subunit beta [Seonamhaeicola sp. ML3]|uniref:UvrD-helicase domain-containing protein n=1 Tax=Seonamhaeicola sp. ML3 TaxID=2937786 RepID=UPI00200BBC33|nr:UvrD-helicase domain-containing protein [Seonamhaeicola sp. ML3]